MCYRRSSAAVTARNVGGLSYPSPITHSSPSLYVSWRAYAGVLTKFILPAYEQAKTLLGKEISENPKNAHPAFQVDTESRLCEESHTKGSVESLNR
jgi:hypothetical protein